MAGGREDGQHGWMFHRRVKRSGCWICHFLAYALNLDKSLGFQSSWSQYFLLALEFSGLGEMILSISRALS